MEMLSGINMGAFSEKQGAIGNKRKDSRSDMSDFWHKYMDSYGEMMVSSGIKTETPVTIHSNAYCSGTRHSGSVTHTAEDD